MLTITVPETRLFDPVSETFLYTKETELVLEHSLVSLSKWEMKYKKPFLNKQHTTDEIDDYIRCMTITQKVNPMVYYAITPQIRKTVIAYMDDPMTAAVIKENAQNQRASYRFITSDLIYYWMVALQIPFECQKWHLNRLLTLIRITNIEQSKDMKKSKTNPAEVARQHHSINSARRAAMHK